MMTREFKITKLKSSTGSFKERGRGRSREKERGQDDVLFSKLCSNKTKMFSIRLLRIWVDVQKLLFLTLSMIIMQKYFLLYQIILKVSSYDCIDMVSNHATGNAVTGAELFYQKRLINGIVFFTVVFFSCKIAI